MAKFTSTFRAKGILDIDTMTIHTMEKDEEKVYDLRAQLRTFDDREITISIKEDIEVEPVEEH